MSCCGSSLRHASTPIASPVYFRPGFPVRHRFAASHVDALGLPGGTYIHWPQYRRPARIYPTPGRNTQAGYTMGGLFDSIFGSVFDLAGSIIGAVSGQKTAKEARKAAQEQFERERQAALDSYRHELDVYDEQQETMRLQLEAQETAREQGIEAGVSFARYAVIGGAVLVAFVAVRAIAGAVKK